MEARPKCVLCGCVEIDHHIPAKYCVKGLPHRPGAHQVQFLEPHEIPQFISHLMRRLVLQPRRLHEPLAQILGNVVSHPLGIGSRTGKGDDLGIYVGCQDAEILVLQARVLVQKVHYDRKRLLSVGATRRPDAKAATRFQSGLGPWQNLVGQYVKVMRLPKEMGHIGGQGRDHHPALVYPCVRTNQRQIGLERVEPGFFQTKSQPRLHHAYLFR